MSQSPYDYSTRQGVHAVSWEDFHGICKALAEAVFAFDPEMILAIGRGGYYPGTLLAHILQVEIYQVRVSRRIRDVVTYDTPVWRVKPPEEVKGQRILIVDEICSSGETLKLVKDEVKRLGASEVRSAVLYAHSWATSVPDYIGLVSDALLMNPWDREIYRDGRFQFHPEYVAALALQGIEADSSLLINATPYEVAKRD